MWEMDTTVGLRRMFSTQLVFIGWRLKGAEPGAIYHAVAEEDVRLRDIVEALGRRLQIPVKSISLEDAQAYFGWRIFCGIRCSRIEQANAEKARMAASRTRVDCRSRTVARR
jgi:hypothetical protein